MRETLEGLGLGELPEFLVLNKSDRLDAGEAAALAVRLGAVAVSALTGDGLEAMLYALEPLLFSGRAASATPLAAGGA